ncbi:MAG: hypothetical protein ACT60Q_24010, partial [Ferrovibrionaceae bacterium]
LQFLFNTELPFSIITYSGYIFPILRMTCIFRYRVTEKLVPFQLHSYQSAGGSSPGRVMYTIANAEMHHAGLSGQIVVGR